MAAEYMLEEAKESADNYALAGLGGLAAYGAMGRVVNSRKVLELSNGTFQDFEELIIRTPSDHDYYMTVAGLCQDGISRISTKFTRNNRYPAKIGIAYDEELHHWAILVCETHGNAVTDGRYHDTGDINNNMGWYKAFVKSEATEW